MGIRFVGGGGQVVASDVLAATLKAAALIGEMGMGRLILICAVGLAVSGAASAQPAVTPPPPAPIAMPPVAPPPPPSAPRGKERSAAPTGSPGEWVTTNDYPLGALRAEAQGTTAFKLTIATNGRVSACTITVSSGSPELDETTCRLVTQRAVFSPALNRKGKAVEGSYSSRIRWVIPQSEPQAVDPESRAMTFIVETDGSATSCIETLNGKQVELAPDKSPCSMSEGFKPFLDAKGQPVRKRVTISFDVRVSDAP